MRFYYFWSRRSRDLSLIKDPKQSSPLIKFQQCSMAVFHLSTIGFMTTQSYTSTNNRSSVGETMSKSFFPLYQFWFVSISCRTTREKQLWIYLTLRPLCGAYSNFWNENSLVAARRLPAEFILKILQSYFWAFSDLTLKSFCPELSLDYSVANLTRVVGSGLSGTTLLVAHNNKWKALA